MAKKTAPTLSNLPPLNTEKMQSKEDQKQADSQNDAGDVEAFFAKNRKEKKGKASKKKQGKASEPTADQGPPEQEASAPNQPVK